MWGWWRSQEGASGCKSGVTIILSLWWARSRFTPWPKPGLMLWDEVLVNRRKKELVMLLWGFQGRNW